MNRVIYIIVPLLFTFHTYVSTDAVEDDYDEAEDYEEYINTNSTTNSSLVFTVGLKNITRNSGKNIKLICEVQVLDLNNSDVRFTWKQNEAPLDKNNRVKIKTFKLQEENRVRSVLRIANINVFDRSFFECIASNGIHKVRSEAYLFTNPDRHFDPPSFSTSKDISFSDPDSLGEMTTFLPNTVPKTEDNDYLSTISKTKTFSPPIEINLDFSDKVAHAPLFNNTEPFCQPYRGQQCKKYLSNVHVFVQPPFTQQEIESKLESAFLVVSQSNDISQSCNKFAVPSLCFSAFPICLHADKIESYQRKNSAEFKSLTVDDRNRFKSIRTNLTNSLRRICRDECILLENELCSKEYSIAKNHLVIGQILEFEECEYLPLDTDASSKNCLTLGVGDLKVNQDEKCYWDAGKLYKGTQDVSYTGKECLRWSHQFLFPLSDYPELAGHNYCRNPGLTEQEPFCYVEQNKRELCGISNCINVFGMYVIFIIVAISSFVILIIAFCYCRRRNKITRNLQNKDLPTASKNIYGNPGPSSPMEMNTLLPPHAPPQRNHNSNKNGLQTVPQYTYKEVRFLQELGEGAFGKVYKGELKAKTGKTFVAVKSLKENASAKTQADFQREIELISELKHPNIICLLGVVMKQEPMCMLFEFMSEGDLHEFLIANSPEESKCLTHDQFLHIAIQIAQGMEYLSGNHYVHRDLAARNCLVSNDMVVKISDFGLSRDMYSCDYYRVQSKSLLPVRWMPPESILYGKFTTESDVWSYGVVLWEIYSYGLQPYYGYNNQEVINMIRSRKLLPCPDACPSYCYSLMVECWAELASRRPNFSEIAHRLKVWKQSGTANGAYFKVPSAQPTPQKQPHTKSYELAQTICPTIDNQMSSFTWEREPKPTSSRLHDSQSSLNSRTSSLGNNTQSTGVSNEVRREHRRNRRNIDSLDRVNPKNTVVSSIGDNFETKLTQQVQL